MHALQAAQLQAHERTAAVELAHELATACASRLLTGWQQQARAQRHYRRQHLQHCLGFWAAWAPRHAASNAGWRAAAQQLLASKLARCFYSWRWYCQVSER